jgi:hypothetical protein
MKYLVKTLSGIIATTLGLCAPLYSHEVPKTWRIVPLLSVKLQKQLQVSALERGINSLLTLNFDQVAGMPLYEKGAPRRIFIIDADDNQTITFSQAHFIHKGGFYKTQPRDVVAYFEGETSLQNLIRVTTGVDNPRGFVYRHGSEIERGMTVGVSYMMSSPYDFFVDTFLLMLQSSVTFQYRKSHCLALRRAAIRPSIFISSCVTDEMFIQEFEKITWETLESYAQGYLKQSNKNVRQLRKAYDQFHRELRKIKSTSRAYNDVLCIV